MESTSLIRPTKTLRILWPTKNVNKPLVLDTDLLVFLCLPQSLCQNTNLSSSLPKDKPITLDYPHRWLILFKARRRFASTWPFLPPNITLRLSVLIDRNAKISSRQVIKLDVAGIYAKTHLVKHHFEILNLCLFTWFCGCVFWWVL